MSDKQNEQTPAEAHDEALSDENMESVSGGRSIVTITGSGSGGLNPINITPTYPTESTSGSGMFRQSKG